MSPEAIAKGGRLVVIGGVAAGMSAASQAKRRRPDIEVVALEKSGFVSYGACGMPYNIEDPERDMTDLVVISPEQFREKRGIDVRLYEEAVKIDRKAKKVLVRKRDGEEYELEYDKLVIATGARARMLDIPGSDAVGVFPLRTLDEGIELKEYMASLKDGAKAVIIGGGYIGMEMSEILTRRGFDVTVVESDKIIRNFSEPVRQKVEETLANNGVKLIYGLVSQYKKREDGVVSGVMLSDGTEIDASLVLVSVGVIPNSEIAKDAGLEIGVNGAIAINKFMQTSDPNIYAAGDCAEAPFKLGGPNVWIPLGTTANKQGKIAGANIAGANIEFSGVLGTSIFRVFDLEVAGTGLNEEQAVARGFEPLSAEITARTRAHAYPGAKKMFIRIVFDKKDGRVIGGEIAAGEGALRINVLAAAIDAGFDVYRLGQMDMAYAPPFAPVWDPILTLASQAEKKLKKG